MGQIKSRLEEVAKKSKIMSRRQRDLKDLMEEEEQMRRDSLSRRISYRLKSQCNRDIIDENKKLYILTLGLPNSGRRTFFKMGRILFGTKTWVKEDLLYFKRIIQVTAVTTIINLMNGAKSLKISIMEQHKPAEVMEQDVHTKLAYANQERDDIAAIQLILSYKNRITVEFNNFGMYERIERNNAARELRIANEKERAEQNAKDKAYREWRTKRNKEGGAELIIRSIFQRQKMQAEAEAEWKEFNRKRIELAAARERAIQLRAERQKKLEEERKMMEALAAEAAEENDSDDSNKSKSSDEDGEEKKDGTDEEDNEDNEDMSDRPFMDSALANAIDRVWKMNGIQEAWKRQEELGDLNIASSTAHIMQHIDDIWKEEWSLEMYDAMCAGALNYGSVSEIQTIGQYTFEMIDTSGLDIINVPKRKWLHIFDKVHVVVFIASLSDYATVSAQDPYKNKLEESMEYFKYLCNIEAFSYTNISVILNKKDIFEEMIATKDLRNKEKMFFLDYSGGPNYENALGYIRKRFQAIAGSNHALYFRECNSLDEADMKIAFGMLRSQAISNAFGAYARKKKVDDFEDELDI